MKVEKRKKVGGRKKGQPNKMTKEIRTWLFNLVENNRSLIEKDFLKVTAERRLMFFEKLISYILPKPQNLDITLEYKELERLLQKTPDDAIEKITAKILHLNSINNDDNESD